MRRLFLLISPLTVMLVWSVVASTVTMWGIGTMDTVWWPTVQWWVYALNADTYTEFVTDWLWIGGLCGTIAGLALTYRIISDGDIRFGKNMESLYGDARFATRRDGLKSGLKYSRIPDPNCLLLGMTKGFLGFFRQYVMLPGVEHVMLYAKTGAGKGISYVLSNCLNYFDSLVVLDLKFENEQISAWFREYVLGQKVFVFSPFAPDGCSHHWNPIGHITEDLPDYVSKLQSKAFSFFPEVEGKEKFWQNGARTAWLGMAVLLCETMNDPRYRDDPDYQLNPGNIFRLFVRSDSKQIIRRLINERRDTDHPYSQVCINLLSDYLNGTKEVVQGMRRHVTTTMGLWFNPKVVEATSRSDFDLRQLRREKMTVYVGVMPADLEKANVLLRMFFLQLYEDNTDATPKMDKTIKHRCHVMLDEATSIAVMKAVADSVGFARGFWLHFSFIVQSKHQIEEKYKDNGLASLLENMGAEIVYATNNKELMEEVSERGGDKTISSISRSMPRFFTFWRVKEQTETTGLIKRPLILPQDVKELPTDEEYIFRNEAPVLHLKRTQWFSDRNFMHRNGTWQRPRRITFTMVRDDGNISFADESDEDDELEAA